MVKYDIFLSYAHGHNDSLIPQALSIYNSLSATGLKVWMDVYNIDVNNEQYSIDYGIKNSKSMLVLLSPDYLKSYFCNYEYISALKTKPIVTCSIMPNLKYNTADFDYIHFAKNQKIIVDVNLSNISTKKIDKIIELIKKSI